jgi:hypothetical protein
MLNFLASLKYLFTICRQKQTMDTTRGVALPKARKQSDLIRLPPASNLHHGIKQAQCLGFNLNKFVSINFSLTSCTPEEFGPAFAEIRGKFGKWVQRPRRENLGHEAPPTFVWVLENPDNCMNAHWMVHVPAARENDFAAMLDKWLEAATGGVHSARAIHIEPVYTAHGVKKYMLKGLHPSLCREYGIDYTNQGWIIGKRIGHSKNIGPARRREMRKQNLYPPARHWRKWR